MAVDPNSLVLAAGSLSANGILGVFSYFLLRGHNQLQTGMRDLTTDQAKRITELEGREREQMKNMWELQHELSKEQAIRADCQARLDRLEGLLTIDITKAGENDNK